MRVRLQYILVILLFALTGMLSRQQPAAAVACDPAGESVCIGTPGNPALDRIAVLCNGDAGRYSFHVLAAPQLTDSALAQSVDHKALNKSISLPGYGASAWPPVAGSAIRHICGPYPGGVDYYIYTLGKIRI